VDYKSSCNNCQKYPLCIVFQKVTKAIQEHSIIHNSSTELFIGLAKVCDGYQLVERSK
jgi:hypothetical protein